ncbi:hypothetical protein HOD38_04465 [archaeon]|jgi:hypothetical protein|nr:hypothetical protein [archaeon]MBT4397495.1 hypothetical protein [archaeon]MBT4440890.1 hypothetical protein [archaeon]
MTGDLETKTLNSRLFEDGFEAIEVIPNDKLPERLTTTMIDLARGKYLDMKVIPGELAFEGIEWQIETPSHIIYAKVNTEYPGHDPKSIYIVQTFFKHSNTGEVEILRIWHGR